MANPGIIVSRESFDGGIDVYNLWVYDISSITWKATRLTCMDCIRFFMQTLQHMGFMHQSRLRGVFYFVLDLGIFYDGDSKSVVYVSEKERRLGSYNHCEQMWNRIKGIELETRDVDFRVKKFVQ